MGHAEKGSVCFMQEDNKQENYALAFCFQVVLFLPSPMLTTLYLICTFFFLCFLDCPFMTSYNVSTLHHPNPTLCLSSSCPFVVGCGLPQIVSPTACDQVVVQQCSIWIMMCWISPNLVMDVLLPLGEASMDGWNFIRFHSALEYNSWKILCVCVCVCVCSTKHYSLIWLVLIYFPAFTFW